MPHSYDYRKLRGRIKEKFGTQAEFSKRLGISEVSVSNKLDIPESDIHAYFFTHKVEKNSTQ